MGDLFNAQAAEATYQRLVDFLNQQTQHVQRLDAQLRDLEASQRAREARVVSTMETKLTLLSDRVTQVEKQIGQQHGRNSSVDERLLRLETAVLQAAQERKEMQAGVHKLEQTTAKRIFQVRSRQTLVAVLALLRDCFASTAFTSCAASVGANGSG